MTETQWLDILKRFVEKNPIVILRFLGAEWESLRDSRNGVSEFTIAKFHPLLKKVKVQTLCIVSGKSEDGESLFLGLITSKGAVTTLDSRIKIKRCLKIQPQTEAELSKLFVEKHYLSDFKSRLDTNSPVIYLSKKMSVYLIDKLAGLEINKGALRAMAESLSVPKRFRGTDALQEDSVHTALSAFGLTSADRVKSLELVKGRATALARVNIIEDSVIEHDARHIPGFALMKSDLSGRAVFERGEEQLEVFTANRRPLEKCFGVDLIYLNVKKKNIIMMQYKMLDPLTDDSRDTDWIYRPDNQLDKEIRRMKQFTVDHMPEKNEYRLNSSFFYLKFVKRDGLLKSGNIIMPLDHFEIFRNDPASKGPKGAIRVSYKNLNGSYLRQKAFLELIQSGYIGSHANTTKQLMILVDSILNSDRAVVAAIQRPLQDESNIRVS